MGGIGRRKFLAGAAAVLACAALLFRPAENLVLTGRMLGALRALAAGSAAEDPRVTQSVARLTLGGRTLEALVYRAEGPAPDRAVVLVPGISRLGCRHPRLAALARRLAGMGFLVVTPDIAMFRRFEASPASVDELAAWAALPPPVAAGSGIRRVGLIGVSFSGTLAVITAARPELSDRIAFVLGIGAYEDLERVARGWFARGPAPRPGVVYPTRCYGRWIAMLAALDRLASGADRALLGDTLRTLLDTERAPPMPAGLGAEGERWYRLAVEPTGGSDPELAAVIERRLAAYYTEMSPVRAAAALRCPVFLAHGAFDDLIPSDESRRLAELIGGRARVLVTPFLTHTHPLEEPLGWMDKINAVAQLLPFFYALAAAAR